MRFATATLLSFVLGAIASVDAGHLDRRACNRAQAVSKIKEHHYTKFCSSLLQETTTSTVLATAYTNEAGQTVTFTAHPLTTVSATLIGVSTSVVGTQTVVVTTGTSTLANPTFPVQQGARMGDRTRPSKPTALAHCPFTVLTRACTQVVPKVRKATETVTSTITTGTAALPVTITEQGAAATVTQFTTTFNGLSVTATTSTAVAAVATAPAYLAFKDPTNTNIVRHLQFDDATTHKGMVVSSTNFATPFVFQAYGTNAAGPINPAHDGLVSGVFTSGSGATQTCLAVDAGLALKTIACASLAAADIWTTTTNRFSVQPTFYYIYVGVFPAELHQLVSDAATLAGTYKYNSPNAAGVAGAITLYLSNSNSTGY